MSARVVSGLVILTAAAIFIALNSSNHSQRASNNLEPRLEEARHEEARRVRQISEGDADVSEPTEVVSFLQQMNGYQELARSYYFSIANVDEETSRTELREQAEQDVRGSYAVLLEDLSLTTSEREAVISLLIEDYIATTTTPYARGQAIDERERSKGIAEIIGTAKLGQFLALERSLGSYSEVQSIENVLRQSGAPMTETQRDRLLKILVDVQEQEIKVPGANAKKGTLEYLEVRLAEIAERERLVVELAPSVLSPKQVQYLFERYQTQWYRRADSLEAQRKAWVDGATERVPLWYPGRIVSSDDLLR